MALEQMTCPQCGGNDLSSAGYNSFRCNFCGGLLKNTPEEKKNIPQPPPVPAENKTRYTASSQTNYRNTYSPLDYEEEDSGGAPMKIILGIAVGALALFILFLVFQKDGKPVDPPQHSFDIEKISVPDNVPDFSKQPSYTESGITVSAVKLQEANGLTVFGQFVMRSEYYQVVLENPKGFTAEKKKVFTGMSFDVKDKDGNILYSSGDLNETNGNAGEASKKYTDDLRISFIVSEEFGFRSQGNFTLNYRVWDKKSKNEITGFFPVFVQN